MEITQSQFELEALMDKQPYQGNYPSVSAYEKQVKHFNGKVKKWAEKFPEHTGKVTFSSRCVPCVGRDTVGECIKCKGFDEKKNKEDLFRMTIVKPVKVREVKKPSIKKRMENLEAFDIVFSPEKKVEKCKVVLAKNEDEAISILKENKGDVKIIEVERLGKPLFNC